MPWPTPGERAAAGLDPDPDVIEGEGEEVQAPEPDAGTVGEPPKKRKKRD